MFGRLIARLIAKLINIFVFELLRFLFEIVSWIIITTVRCLFWGHWCMNRRKRAR